MIAYFDCFSGISGDMTLGALVDAGVPFGRLRKELSLLPVTGYTLSLKKVKRAGFRATKVDVNIKSQAKDAPLRKWKDIKGIIQKSRLRREIKDRGLAVFRRFFEAEARVHGSRYDRIHLHELAAVDCIVDIFGTLIGLDLLGVETVYASPVNLGRGTITSDHGILPVPAPATLELLKGRPVYSSDIDFELTTPTGAALISFLAKEFGDIPLMHLTAAGIGAGGRNFRDHANILRIFIGSGMPATESGSEGHPEPVGTVLVVETNIDDMNPQVYEYVMDQLFSEGALDVFLSNIIMKKGRPGIKLSVLCHADKAESVCAVIFRETSSIGLRYYSASRKTLKREIRRIQTGYGTMKLKVVDIEGEGKKFSPEYEDCRRIAKRNGVSLIEVIDHAKSQGSKVLKKRGRK